jgi:hypothetical protein
MLIGKRQHAMTLNPRKSPTVFSVLVAALALAVAGTTAPLWHTVRYFGSGPRHCTLWRVLEGMLLDLEDRSQTGKGLLSTLEPYYGTFRLIAVIFVIGGTLGRVCYWWLWERRRGDHDDPSSVNSNL